MSNGSRNSDTVAVVGAGIVGLCTAWSLVKRGMRVVVYDPDPPGSRCSSGNAGAISPGSVVPLAMPGLLTSVPRMMLNPQSALHIPTSYWMKALPWLAAFVAQATPKRVNAIAAALSTLYTPAFDRHQALLSEIGASDIIRKSGQLYLYRNKQQLAGNHADWELRKTFGVTFDVIGRDEIDALEPQVGAAYQIGVFLPNAGMSINPHRQAEAIAEALTREGTDFQHQRIVGFSREGSRISGVVTEDGNTIRHRAVVVAAGAWSAQLLKTLDYRVPLEAQRGYHIDFRESGISISRPIVPADRKVFITPMETGLRVAGTVEIAGLEAPPTEKRAKLLYNDLIAALPEARTSKPAPYWMGHRPCLPDSLPVLGPSAAWCDLHFAFGHGHLGLSGSAVTGDLISQVIAGERPAIDISPFRIERF
jgi:D-amino-acid dehydrogenase